MKPSELVNDTCIGLTHRVILSQLYSLSEQGCEVRASSEFRLSMLG